MNPIPINNENQGRYIDKMLRMSSTSMIISPLEFTNKTLDFNQKSEKTCTKSIFSKFTKCSNEAFKIIENPDFSGSDIDKFFFYINMTNQFTNKLRIKINYYGKNSFNCIYIEK
jgi:hypothetical protein